MKDGRTEAKAEPLGKQQALARLDRLEKSLLAAQATIGSLLRDVQDLSEQLSEAKWT